MTYLWQDVMPKITSITARMNSIIFTGKQSASKIPAPKAVKTRPFGHPLLLATLSSPPDY